ncbi:MAG: 4-(cytidine 5'-diphospho)-2-C-methyl-D-erythritol kinase [Emcibacter sp.]|nr:4-(cytidine 5'-diphospho)-2-C-methyl-D-erythritol kinase [Emcibacter sp.]
MAKSDVICPARAKINLDLLVTGQREDGYHLLDSLVVFADFGDEIFVRPSPNLLLNITGPFAADLTAEQDNIILRAARLLKRKFDIQQGAEIELVKNLPVSSGIGGGSADAAAALHALMALWNIDQGSDLSDLTLSLGADVPVCMVSETTQMTGVGEKLKPVTLKFPLFLLLVNPGVAVSTADIFKARAIRKAKFSAVRRLPDEIKTVAQLIDIIKPGGNDLEFDACSVQPEIKKVLMQVRGGDDCIAAGMSGSGATCFGIFSNYETANRLATNISCNFPDWWVMLVRVR